MKLPGPDHPITIEPHAGRVIVRFKGTVVADTPNALVLKEASYKPVFYIPRNDAKWAQFAPSDRQTHCPYKGDASYFHLTSEGGRAENAVWSYENPFPAMKAIERHIAFYPHEVEIESIAPSL
jgi:uncharacterized protein (DUF427 family)